MAQVNLGKVKGDRGIQGPAGIDGSACRIWKVATYADYAYPNTGVRDVANAGDYVIVTSDTLKDDGSGGEFFPDAKIGDMYFLAHPTAMPEYIINIKGNKGDTGETGPKGEIGMDGAAGSVISVSQSGTILTITVT